MKTLVKHAALHTLRAAGLFALAARARRRNTLLILCYHGIALRDEHQWEGGLYITPAQFRERLQWLRDAQVQVLPLGEALERLQAGSLPPRSVALTFDDGFYDFYRHAFPLLREFGFPCTLYLTTYYADYRLPIFNLVLNYLLWRSGAPEGAAQDSRLREVQRHMADAASRNLDTPAKDEVARQFAESHGIDYDALLRERLFQIMSSEEVSEIARGGIDVELHTHRHRTPLDRDLFVREIRDNALRIRELTGRAPRHFCYPSGVTAPEFLPWLRECGVHSATTCVPGLATAATEPLLLPRFLDGSGVERIDFEAWLCGVR